MKRVLLPLLCSAFCSGAIAQVAGDTVVTAGGAWLNFANSSSGNLVSSSPFGTFASNGTNSEIHNALTEGIFITRYFTDNIAVEGALAFPPKLNMYAQGNAAPLGAGGPNMPLGSLQPLASARTWPAMALLKYAFGRPDASFRPFLGLGVNYTWYSGIELNPAFYQAAQAFAGSGGSVQSSLHDSWNPVFTAGFTYRMAERWYAMGTLMYIPLKTDAEIRSTAANGQTVMTNRIHINADPVIAFVGVGYRF
ncbi:OmpW family protein [Burkholderia diffusa]|uniref:OmpW/AlkL family protein n=1 Tax=Burkholderia diffusa TaxID=488732 RepID=UPI001CABDF75|nr:OmpW family outer membrane protein [Burkholderia diffusa]CAG9264431.1 OmpW family protein [Burkholderia diffusa]